MSRPSSLGWRPILGVLASAVVVVVVVAVAVVVYITVGASKSSPGWKAIAKLQPDDNALGLLSCTSTVFCLGVDYNHDYLSWNGRQWSPPSNMSPNVTPFHLACSSSNFCLAGTSGAYETFEDNKWTAHSAPFLGLFDIQDLACPRTGFCIAIDSNGDATEYQGSFGWTFPQTIDDGHSLNGISCVTADYCAVVDSAGQMLIFDGSHWYGPLPIDKGHNLTSISCWARAACAAVDQEGRILTIRGSDWSQPTPLGITGPLQVACTGVSFCAAIGAGDASIYNGVFWSKPVKLKAQGLESLSCPAPKHCFALDDGGAIFYYGDPRS